MIAMEAMRLVGLACLALSQPLSAISAALPGAIDQGTPRTDVTVDATGSHAAIDAAQDDHPALTPLRSSPITLHPVFSEEGASYRPAAPGVAAAVVRATISLKYLDFVHALAAP